MDYRNGCDFTFFSSANDVLVWFGLYICPYKPKPIFIEAGQKKKWVGCNDGSSLGGHRDGSFGPTAFLKYLSGRLEAVMWLSGCDGQLRIYKSTQICSFGCKFGCRYNKSLIIRLYCGERGIRTPGGVTLNGFQDRRNRPLCHLSLLL